MFNKHTKHIRHGVAAAVLALTLVLPSFTTVHASQNTHTITRGESWWSIGAKYGVNYLELAAHNGKSASQTIYVGQTLRIPGKSAPSTPTPTETSHVVVRNESWWSIGNKYGVNYHELARYNGKTASQYIYVGEVLKIPGTGTQTPLPDPTPTPPTPTPTPPGTTQTHVVTAGESWWSIGRKYGVDYHDLAHHNGKLATQTIYVGQTLKIPGTGNNETSPTPPPTSPSNPGPGISVRTNTLSSVSHKTVTVNGQSSWNSEYTTPYLLDVDMSTYIGRSKNSDALKGIVVIIDPGHGGTDPGAVRYVNGQRVSETLVNTPMGQMLRTELEALGATVVMTRSSDSYRSLYGRVAEQGTVALDIWERELSSRGLSTGWIHSLRSEMQGMESSSNYGIATGTGVSSSMRLLMDAEHQLKNVIFISLHANSSTSTNARGQQIYITPKSTAEYRELLSSETPRNPFYQHHNDAEDRTLATHVLNATKQSTPELNTAWTRIFDDMSFAVLRHSAFPSILVEAGFLSNVQDATLLTDPAVQRTMAEGIAHGVYTYFTN